MYVTIARVPGGGVTVCGTTTTPEPPTVPAGIGPTCTAPLCPPEQIDRTTGMIHALQHMVTVERSFAAAVASTRPAPHLVGPVAGILAHPGIGQLLVVGPFDGPTDLDHWWHSRADRLAITSLVCLPIPLTATPTDATGGAR